MLKFPLKFEVTSVSPAGISSVWKSQAGGLPPIPSAIPPEFMGPGKGYSPEDLFAISVMNCIIATYKVYCEKSKISFQEILGKATLTVDMQDGSLKMTHLDIAFDVKGATDIEKARKVLDNAIRDCAVSNSIKSGKTFKITVS
ncbi:MAG: OsmC family protein [Chlamydiae bacterium]|nr:OsmC family protein [Chlamydiota bacterium]